MIFKDFKFKLDLVKTLLSKPSLLRNNFNHVFLLSHMRGNTSLLSHILGSHDEILGNSELQIPYGKLNKGLILSKALLQKEFGNASSEKFLFDKVLHNALSGDTDFSDVENAKLIFMVRDPESTIKSITQMWKNNEGGDYNWSAATQYYIERLEYLVKLFETTSADKIVIFSNDLIENTDKTLTKLSEFIGVKTPLSPEYKVHENTGIAGKGDQSANIYSGKILSNKDKKNRNTDPIPEQLLMAANKAFQHFLLVTSSLNR